MTKYKALLDHALVKLGQNISTIRKKKKVSQLELAAMAEVSKSYVCDLEHGRRNVSVALIIKIASALRVKPSELLEGVID